MSAYATALLESPKSELVNKILELEETRERLIRLGYEGYWHTIAVELANELASTWNAVGMLGKRDWKGQTVLKRFQEVKK